VHGQAGGDGLGGEDPAEVVRAEPCWGAVGVGDLRVGDEFVEEFGDTQVGDCDVADSPAALEQERQRWAVPSFGLVTENLTAVFGSPAAPFVPLVPLVPFAPSLPLAPLLPFVPDLPDLPWVLKLSFFSDFLHFVFLETMRIVPPFFFWQA